MIDVVAGSAGYPIPLVCVQQKDKPVAVALSSRFTCPSSVTIPPVSKVGSVNVCVDRDNKFRDGTDYLLITSPGSASSTTLQIWDDEDKWIADIDPKFASRYSRCDPSFPEIMEVTDAGDVGANQQYKKVGAKGNYYCTYVGTTRSNWAIGVRQPMQPGVGLANFWQIWWNKDSTATGGVLRYQSINTDFYTGYQGPYAAYTGEASPAGTMLTVKSVLVGVATEFACLWVQGAGAPEFNDYYRWVDTNADGKYVFRGVNNVLLSIRAELYNPVVAVGALPSGYWRFMRDGQTLPHYETIKVSDNVLGEYKIGALQYGGGTPYVQKVDASM